MNQMQARMGPRRDRDQEQCNTHYYRTKQFSNLTHPGVKRWGQVIWRMWMVWNLLNQIKLTQAEGGPQVVGYGASGRIVSNTENEWYEWAKYTARNYEKESCLMCAPSPLKVLQVIPNPYSYKNCADFNRNFCHLKPSERPYCPAVCLGFLGEPSFFKWYNLVGWGDWCRKLDVKIDAQKLESPKRYKIDKTMNFECFNRSKGTEDLGEFKGNCEVTWHIEDDSNWKVDIPRLWNFQVTGSYKGKVIRRIHCENQTIVVPSEEPYLVQSEAIADFYWICGGKELRATLPKGWKGICARVQLLQEVTIVKWEGQIDEEVWRDKPSRVKRAYEADPRVTIDSVGQPRGIPEEYKARNEIKVGFESIFIWVTPNKNVEWINYIYYNQQRFINYTDDALGALGEQVHATSRMAWQNRQALDWLLAERGGVCVLFGDQCCTFIPNNTAPEGSFTEAMKNLRELRKEVKDNAGQDVGIWDWFDLKLGNWGGHVH
ncbi:hypothetical protein SKAU_G00273680 [Synaphobranchus kaupii]|uniref:Uncharacterized protein n=1 Tax=Synaphobranchus kaupii TaxID=118154 RepID=A0A9Q1IQU6_SYNKA|nr:hypothetical protein SKAU_G00273680 [Synaphobranchus kaupii]